MVKAIPIITNFDELTMAQMLEVVKKAEARREAQCRASALCYLRRRAREAGLSIEDYTLTLDPRGTPRKYFPPGVSAPARRPCKAKKSDSPTDVA